MISYGAKEFSWHKNFCLTQIFSRPNFFGQNFFSDQKNLGNKSFQTQHFFRLRMFLDPMWSMTLMHWEWSLTLALAQHVLILDGVWGLFLIQTFLKIFSTPALNGFSDIYTEIGTFLRKKIEKAIWQNSLTKLLILTNHISYRWKGLTSKLSFSGQVRLIK